MPSSPANPQPIDWTPRNTAPPRSVFGNYPPSATILEPTTAEPQTLSQPADITQGTLQAAIDSALARTFIYRYLAQAYQEPTPETWSWLCAADTRAALRTAALTLAPTDGAFAPGLPATIPHFHEHDFEAMLQAGLAAFGHAARGQCPLNEIEYGDIKADPLFQPHRLADLAAFYRAFGVELADDAGERPDHLCLQLEFMTVLCAKEAYAHEFQHDPGDLALCRDAQKKFLREHLGRWTPAFTRRLARTVDGTPLAALAHFTRAFLESECARLAVPLGSEDLLLRPVDESAESLCAACGLTRLPPGALATAET